MYDFSFRQHSDREKGGVTLEMYEKPEITKVGLVPEEAVLTSCKLQVQGPNGPAGAFCGGQNGHWFGMCDSPGS